MRGIAGIKGREPIGAVLSLGIKGPSGNPIDRDFWHVLNPDGSGCSETQWSLWRLRMHTALSFVERLHRGEIEDGKED